MGKSDLAHGLRVTRWPSQCGQIFADDTDPRSTVLLQPESDLGDLFGSLKLERLVASTHEEKQAARDAMARETAGKGSP